MFRVIALCCVLAACATDSSTGIDVATLECPPDSALTYESFGQLAIADHCLSCHAGKQSPRLGTVEEVRAHKSAILDQAVASTSMPQGGDMLLEERQLLGEWLACGAP
jgi:uncharacterized membrane protein